MSGTGAPFNKLLNKKACRLPRSGPRMRGRLQRKARKRVHAMRAAGMAPCVVPPSRVGPDGRGGSLEWGRLERKPHSGLVVWAGDIGDVWRGSPTQGQECEDVWSGSPTQSQECDDIWIGSPTRGQGHGGCPERAPHLGPGV